jgi:S1-C subfamily serine protease
MSALKTVIIAVLSALAGIALQFGFNGVAQRQAVAALDGPGGGLMAAALTPGGAVAPGGTFVTQVYKQVSPMVVHITNRVEQQQFNIFSGPFTSVSEAVGSGVIVDPAGYILTNSHVIETADRQKLTVVLSDQTQYDAKVVGNDPSTDLALLKIEAGGKQLPAATFGDSNSVEIGEWVVAIGNPRGFDWTVTAGVISAKNRSGPAWIRNNVVGPTITGLLQTDAAINPGNSGGPLLNARGEVIGINERIFSQSGGNEGIGLAIPSNTAKAVFNEIKQYGRVQRSWLGVNVQLEVDPQNANYYNFPVKHGLLIGNIVKESPAANSGIVPGRSDRTGYAFDIVSAVDGKAVKSAQDLVTLVRNRKPGEVVKLHLYRVRNGRTSEADVSVTLSAVPAQADTSGFI